jgi:hypothetical protein
MNTSLTYTNAHGKTISYNVVNVSNGYMPTTFTTEYQSGVIVHHDHTGFVIGSRGATVKQIGRSSHTWVHVMPGNEFSRGHPWFIIKGANLESVSTAHHYITTIAMEAQNRLPRTMSPLIPLAMGPDGGGCALTANDRDNIAAYWQETDDFAVSMPEPSNFLSEDDYMFDAMLTDFECNNAWTENFIDQLCFIKSLDNDEMDSLLRISDKTWHYNVGRLARANDDEPWDFDFELTEHGIPYTPKPKYTNADRNQLFQDASEPVPALRRNIFRTTNKTKKDT